MSTITRRAFLLSTAVLPIGCAMRGPAAAAGSPKVALRAPEVGQSWRYAKHDLFTGKVVDHQIDTVAKVNHTIHIDSRTEGGAAATTAKRSWGSDLLSKYTGHEAVAPAELPSEIQDPWGMVLVDPHWAQVQVYEAPIPLWPTQLEAGWSSHVMTKYKTPSDTSAGLLWDQTMRAVGWETVTVPAGTFRALRYTNYVHFTSADSGRRDSLRHETVWFAPEVGRWVVRESSGTYLRDESVDDTPANESSYRWELLSWT